MLLAVTLVGSACPQSSWSMRDRRRHVPLLLGCMPLLGVYAANILLYTTMSNPTLSRLIRGLASVDAGASCSGRRRCTTGGRNGRWCTRCLIRPQRIKEDNGIPFSLFDPMASSCSSQIFSCSSSQILEAANLGGV